jgi:hypothetical protein
MNLKNTTLGRQLSHHRSHRMLQVESLETRNLMAADYLEPNNSLAAATSVVYPQSVNMVTIHSSTDVDYYRFAVPPGNSISGPITMDITGGGDLDMELLNSSGSVISSSRGTTSSEVINVSQLPAPGIGNYYYLKVYGYAGATSSYRLYFDLRLSPSTNPNPNPNPNPSLLPRDTVGLLDPTSYTWYLNNRLDGSLNPTTFQTPIVPSWWVPLSGDWDGNGTDTVGLYDPSTSTWYLNNSTVGSLSSVTSFRTPPVPSSWIPITGDWNGDGRDSIGLYDPFNSKWYLNNRIDGSTSDLYVVQTPRVPSSWRPITGDWDGNGVDTIGLYDPFSSRWYLNNRLDGSTSNLVTFQTPAVPSTWIPIAGDWNSDNRDTVGLYDQFGSVFYLNNRADGSISDLLVLDIPYTLPTNWKPLAGNWDGSNIPANNTSNSITGGARTLAEGEADETSTQVANSKSSFRKEDVNRDGLISSMDVLRVINAINANAEQRRLLGTTNAPLSAAESWADVDMDGQLTSQDALKVINAIWADSTNESIAPANEIDEQEELISTLASAAALYQLDQEDTLLASHFLLLADQQLYA